ncbi:hypothetical protein [Psychroflexus sp. ALD_RP9]|uniref:hypothetical protein n=1 Tax=Psychroflexus sp. ALD_RP9 TaxID=2777186 RepID=UPI001A8C674E|nr:hypothetical protein [Psychroflexus sp. ALD_RP9]QSS97026.1 hypothetical protein IMZ30_11370 [Psychroflexus sp. ALD_RP9]
MRKLLLLLLATTLFYSCESDDENSIQANNYFDLNVGNSWTYNNTITQDDNSNSGTETLEVSGVETINNQDHFSFTQTNVEQPGLVTSILTSGELYKTNDNAQLVFTGNYNFEATPELPSLNFELNNATIYNQSAQVGASVYNQSNTITHEIQGVPVNINYSINIINGGNIGDLSVNNETYQNVYQSEIIISANIEADLGLIDVTVLQQQDVVTATNYFAPNIGLIRSDVITELIFEDLPQISLPDISSTSSQELIDFSLTID